MVHLARFAELWHSQLAMQPENDNRIHPDFMYDTSHIPNE